MENAHQRSWYQPECDHAKCHKKIRDSERVVYNLIDTAFFFCYVIIADHWNDHLLQAKQWNKEKCLQQLSDNIWTDVKFYLYIHLTDP